MCTLDLVHVLNYIAMIRTLCYPNMITFKVDGKGTASSLRLPKGPSPSSVLSASSCLQRYNLVEYAFQIMCLLLRALPQEEMRLVSDWKLQHKPSSSVCHRFEKSEPDMSWNVARWFCEDRCCKPSVDQRNILAATTKDVENISSIMTSSLRNHQCIGFNKFDRGFPRLRVAHRMKELNQLFISSSWIWAIPNAWIRSKLYFRC